MVDRAFIAGRPLEGQGRPRASLVDRQALYGRSAVFWPVVFYLF